MRLAVLAGVASLALLAPGSGVAATTVGQVAPDGAAGLSCPADTGLTQGSSAADVAYVSPGTGVITEWRVRHGTGTGALALQTLDRNPFAPAEFAPIAGSAVEAPVAGLNRFETRVPIVSGQYVGLRIVAATGACAFPAASGNTTFGAPPPAPAVGGGFREYGDGQGNRRMNLEADIEPDGDRDGYGDESQDGCPGIGGRQDDCVDPRVTIDKGPRKQTRKKRAKFRFSADEPDVAFECSIDGKRFKPCGSPFTTKALKPRKHTFAVRAVDGNGNTSTEAGYKWKVRRR